MSSFETFQKKLGIAVQWTVIATVFAVAVFLASESIVYLKWKVVGQSEDPLSYLLARAGAFAFSRNVAFIIPIALIVAFVRAHFWPMGKADLYTTSLTIKSTMVALILGCVVGFAAMVPFL